MRAAGPAALRQKWAAARPLMPPPTTTRSYRSPVSTGAPAVFQNEPSFRLWATANEPSWLPRKPVNAGGYGPFPARPGGVSAPPTPTATRSSRGA
jgi:hypothetical protein